MLLKNAELFYDWSRTDAFAFRSFTEFDKRRIEMAKISSVCSSIGNGKRYRRLFIGCDSLPVPAGLNTATIEHRTCRSMGGQ